MSNDIFDEVTDSTIFILWLAVCIFVFGFASINIPRHLYISKNYHHIEKKISKILDNRIFIVLLCAFTVYMVWCYLQFFAQIQMDGIVGSLRSEYYSSDITIYGTRFVFLRDFLFSPGELILSAFLCYCLLRKRGIICWILLLGLFLYHSLGGGRFGYIRMILDLLIVYVIFCINNKLFKIKFRYVAYSIVFLLGLYFVLTIVTSMRKGTFEGYNIETFNAANETTFQEIRTYNFGPIVAFDKAIDNNNFIHKIGGYTYGGLFIGPLIYLYRNVCVTFLGMEDFEQPYKRVARIQQDSKIRIGPDGICSSWNALYTWNISFFADFGYLGIIFFNFIIGVWLRSIIRLFYRAPTISSFLLICVIFRMVIWSVINTNFNNLMLWVLIFTLYYFHECEKKLLLRFKKIV